MPSANAADVPPPARLRGWASDTCRARMRKACRRRGAKFALPTNGTRRALTGDERTVTVKRTMQGVLAVAGAAVFLLVGCATRPLEPRDADPGAFHFTI